MSIYFIADTHLGHDGIINFCNRPFGNVDKMNQAIFDYWSQTVNKNDIVYHLGDVLFNGKEDLIKKIKKLPGKKFLVPGNHDNNLNLLSEAFEILPLIYSLKKDAREIVLCHYPLLEWPSFFSDALHFHGHTHGRIAPDNRRIDVGVDVWNFAPVNLMTILLFIKNCLGNHK